MNVISNTTIITDSLESWHKSQSTFKFQGYEIGYHVQGKQDAPCLLLIHGYPTASWDWHNQWAALTQHFKVFTLDMLGFGFSDKPQNVTYTINMQADLLTYFLKVLNVKAAHILSHDYGDTVAQELLARSNLNEPHAIKIQSVCFLNGGLFPETHKPVLLQKLLFSPIGALKSRLANYKSFKRNFDNMCSIPLAEKGLNELWQLIEYKQGRPVMAKPKNKLDTHSNF
ncbi:Mesoderm-specific transcript homolog protein (fragment) [Pseudoalteromonas sp. 3J6]|uniref:alpha/beta fold hydrolase n=1 Tax=Pseudoalteromonas sp. 3J6 TaxID=649161 RepID=UPI0017719DE2